MLNLRFLIALCLTLGLAPFFPEPHIVGKMRWVFGGGVGMKSLDYLDLVMHGTPWLLLIVVGIKKLISSNTESQEE
ncbi:MAG: hypothetical protein JXR07_11995 [Reichenbachiella sp.]